MSAWKEIGEIGKSILKGSAVMVGTKRLATFADRAIPVAAEKSREAWDRIKNTKSTGKKKPEDQDEVLFEDDEQDGFSEVKEQKLRTTSQTLRNQYDADFEDKQGE